MAATVHLVGSLPPGFGTAEKVFTLLSGELGARAPRLPDGEVGARQNWIMSQLRVYERNPAFERYEEPPDRRDPGRKRYRFRIKKGAKPPNAAELGPLGYADGAAESYDVFARLKRDGKVHKAAKFQVSIPTPYDIVGFSIDHADYPKIYPVYEQAILAEIDRIAAAIPHGELALQWDVAHEFEYLASHASPPFVPIARDEVVALLVRLGERVPKDVELGYHCCYGDYNHKHFIEPKDTGDMVDVMNAVSARIGRKVEFVHMPVPKDRSDDAYFAPLKNLKLRPETQLYLGLVHFTDKMDGTNKRIAAARKFAPAFGVATECGLGRRAPETIPELLRVHVEAAKLLD